MPINNLITIRKGSEAEWISSGSILASGEPGFDTTNGIFKIGDGVSTWDNLLNKAVFSELELNNQTSGSTIFNIEGTNGSLFSVVDNLDGTLMSVNNNAGLPVFEVFSDDSIVGGRFGQNDFVVSSSGNVGIGKEPDNAYKLDVKGKLNLANSLGDNVTFSVDENLGDLVVDVGGSEKVRVDTNGKVGIGITSPLEQLEVDGNIKLSDTAGNRIQLYRGGGSSYDYTIGKNGNHIAIAGANDSSTNRYVQFGYYNGSSWNPQTVINSYTGNVGIGTASPSHTLHVAGSGLVSDGLYANFVNINGSTLTSANGSLVVNGIITTQNNSIRASDFGIYGDTNNRIRKSDGTTLAYEVSSSGNAHSFGYTSTGTHYSWVSINTTGVGIGTTTPSNKLEVAGGNVLLFPSDNTRQLNLYSSSYGIKASSGLEIFTGDAIRFKKGSTENVTIDTNGNVGIGTNVPSTKLDVSGIITATDGNSTNWNTAYGWGNHASAGYAPLNSPTLTGIPLAPTANSGTNTTQIATTAFVRNEVTALVDSAPATLDTLNELAAALGDDPNFATTVTNSLAGKSPLSHTHTHDDITDFDSAVSDLLPTISNPVDNRILTSTGTSTGINAESNATFDGTTLAVSGEITIDNLKLDGNTLSATNTDGNIIVQTNGTGAIQRDINGDARGNYAVDLQNVRSDNSQVASGNHAVILGGNNNTASGEFSSIVSGKNTVASLYAERAHSAGSFVNSGDAQHRILILRGRSTTNSVIDLRLDGDLSGDKYLFVPEYASWNFSIKVIARNSYTLETAGYNFVGILENFSNTGAGCNILHQNKVVLHEDDSLWDCSISINYSNNNPYLNIQCSYDHSQEDVYWVAVVDIAQVITPINSYVFLANSIKSIP